MVMTKESIPFLVSYQQFNFSMTTSVKSASHKSSTLQGLAAFIRTELLEQFTTTYVRRCNALNHFPKEVIQELDEKTTYELAKKNITEFLQALSMHGDSYIDQVAIRWSNANLPLLDKNRFFDHVIQVETIKKEILINFMDEYVDDVTSLVKVLKEVDQFFNRLLLEVVSKFRESSTDLQHWSNEREDLLTRLQQSEELSKQAQALAHVGNWDWNISENKVHWTDELYRIYGLEPQSTEITLESFLDFVHPQDVELVMEETRKTIQEKQAGNFYHRIILPSGVEKILHARSEALTDDKGEVIKIIGTSQDVTTEKLLERKNRDSQIFIEKIAHATPCVIASYNIQSGKYVFVSAGLTKLLGYQPEEVLQQGTSFFLERIHPDDLAPLMLKNAEALKRANDSIHDSNEPIVEFQYRVRHSNGQFRWLHTFGTVFDRNQNNEVEHVLNISLDITDAIDASEVLKQRTIELQQSNASLEEFAFVASHDLKEPLRKIITFSDRLIVTETSSISNEGRSLLNKITNSTIRMEQMINDLLSLSVVSADKTFSRVNLKKLLEDVLITFEHRIEERQAKIEISELPDMNVVPSQIRQLFQNILSNAFKFSKQNVSPVIAIRHRIINHSKLDDASVQKSEQYLELEISDNGIGFDNSQVDKIFAVFQRLHERTSYEGTGIGLAICKKIVENHGGRIFATGRPMDGAIFTILLPFN